MVFAQRNPLAEMYPNAVFRNFEQEKVDECLEVSRQPSQPSAHIVFCRACASFMMSLGRKRKPGSGGKFKADGITPRVVSRIHPDDKAAAAKAAKKKYMEGTVGTRVDKDVMAIWIGFEKPEGELNRWLNKLARAAKVAGATSQCSSTCSDMAAAEEVDAEKLKRHKPRDTKNPRINCKSPSPCCASCYGNRVLAVLGWRRRCCRAVVGVVAAGWRGGVLVQWLAAAAAVRRSSTQHSGSFDLRSWFVVRLLVCDPYYKHVMKSHKIVSSLSYKIYMVFNL